MFTGISVTNKCVSNKSIFHKSISDESLISIFVLFWDTNSISILRIAISEIGGWASEEIKTKF